MTVLVTGATGFIGKRLCHALSAAGHAVAALSRNPDAARQDLSPAFGHPSPVPHPFPPRQRGGAGRGGPGVRAGVRLTQVYEWNPLRALPPAQALESAEAIVHLAGERVAGRWTAEKKKLIYDSRVLSTRNLVRALSSLKQRPKTLISASAIGYYSDRGNELLTETAEPGSGFLADVCQAWETEALTAQELGVRVVCLRIGIVLGAGGGALPAMLLPFKLGLGGPLGSGKQWWSWIHRDDVVGLIVHALTDSGLHGSVNATAPAPVRQREFARVLGKLMRRPAFMPAPSFALKLILGEFSSELLSSKRVIPQRASDAEYKFRYPELEPALASALGRER